MSEAVVAAVSAASRADPTELDPLYAAIAPDALDALFDLPARGRPHGNHASVTLEYESYRVRVETVTGLRSTDGGQWMDDFAFDCEFCETSVRAESVEAVKDRGTTHLETHHREDLTEPFVGQMAGEQCREGCGYTFPVGVAEVAGFECPNCDHDHFPSFLKRYLYWRIESG